MTEDERAKLAKNPNTPGDILDQLSRDEEVLVRVYVAGNHSTPVETLAELSRDQEEWIRTVVAKNPKWKRLEEAGILDRAIAASKYLGIL